MMVTKRNGVVVPFEAGKIENAIRKAFIGCGYTIDGKIIPACDYYARRIAADIEATGNDYTVEKIQDIVERKLMETPYKDVAKAYINYRQLHQMSRNQYAELMQAISEKLSGSNIQNQNANVDEASFGGRTGEATSVITKQYALNYLVSPMAKKNHENNEIYIHDLDSYAVGSHNCLSIPFDDLLANGFNTRQTDVRPAQSVSTAFQLVAVIFQLQSLQQFGGVSATHIDHTMVPYVRKSFWKHWKDGLNYFFTAPADDPPCVSGEISITDPYYTQKEYEQIYKYAYDMTEREVYQAVEGMYHNLNTLQSRSGNQLPFTSINYGTCTLPEGRMVTKALLEVLITGVGKLHKTSIFPCGIFQYMKGVNDKPGTPNYDLKLLALKATAQRLYPNYANIDWSGNAGYDRNDPRTYFSTMGKVDILAHVKSPEPRQRVFGAGSGKRAGFGLTDRTGLTRRNFRRYGIAQLSPC